MTRTITLLAAAAFALGTIPAQAQDPTDFSASGDAFIAGAQAFEEGDASETRPQEQAEWAYCAGYWNVWTDAVDDGTVPEGRLEPLSAILQPPSNAFQTLGIFMKLEESDTLDAEVEEGRVEARKFLAEALAGDELSAQSLFGTLGACSV